MPCQNEFFFCQSTLGRPMVRRLALGSPYAKPSTAEDGLPHPTIRFHTAGLHSASIVAVHILRNATIGVGTTCRNNLRLLALGLKRLERRNRAQRVASVITTLAAHCFQ